MAFYALQAKTIQGKPFDFKTLAGKPVLIINVASKCGFTSQYKQLEELNQKYKDQGLVVLGFPCNQFMGQESGTASDIESFCKLNFGVTFQMMEKIDVNGKGESPVYTYLKNEVCNPWYTRIFFGNGIKWNFEKFIVDRQGKVAGRYASTVDPLALKEPIEKVL